MRRSQQAFSVPSKQTQSSNAKDEPSSTASINASSTTLIPSSKLLASKPRDCTLKREQNSCYEHDNGLTAETISSWVMVVRPFATMAAHGAEMPPDFMMLSRFSLRMLDAFRFV